MPLWPKLINCLLWLWRRSSLQAVVWFPDVSGDLDCFCGLSFLCLRPFSGYSCKSLEYAAWNRVQSDLYSATPGIFGTFFFFPPPYGASAVTCFWMHLWCERIAGYFTALTQANLDNNHDFHAVFNLHKYNIRTSFFSISFRNVFFFLCQQYIYFVLNWNTSKLNTRKYVSDLLT